jgi:hypothetical protein
MNCEMWQAADATDPGKHIGVAPIVVITRVGDVASEKLRVQVGGELVGALTTLKDFQTVKA